MTFAESTDPIRCAKGLRVVPDHTLDDHPTLDVVLVPGGHGVRREVDNVDLMAWLARTGGDRAGQRHGGASLHV